MLSSDNEQQKEANLRFLANRTNCNFSFRISHKCGEFFELNEDILCVRQVSETVDSFLEHTKNKILKIIQNQTGDKENVADETKIYPSVDLKLSLKNKNNNVSGRALLKELERYKHLNFTIFDSRYPVIVNAPLIECIKLPDVIYGGHTLQPSQFKAVLYNHQTSEYQWYKSLDKNKWIPVGSEYVYFVPEADIDFYLKFVCVPCYNDKKSAPVEVISDNPVQLIPEVPYCPFEERHKLTPNYLTGDQFRVVSYNTLSCRYVSHFQYCPSQFLAIDYRKQLLFKELIGYKADIICLQEVDNKIFSFYFRDGFKKLGFGSIYNKKGNRIPEGLAIFYSKNRFKFAGQGQIVFSSEIKTNPHLRGVLRVIENDSVCSGIFMKQPTSLQYCKLASKNSNELIIVANTHLYYHPDANNVRLAQTAVCLEYLKHMYNKELKNPKNQKVSVIFCGDFNSTPESSVYKFVTDGVIPYKSDDIAACGNTTLFHPFQFTSACGTPKFTNYTDDFRACLDYIFVGDNVARESYVPFPLEEVIAQNVAIPSQVFPSDHLALVADLKFKLCK